MNWLTLTLLAAASCVSILSSASPSGKASYEEYLSIVQAKLERPRRRSSRGHCELFAFNLTVTNQQECVGYIPLFGCAGRCRTSETPQAYKSRQAANVPNPMISTCKCCSHTSALLNITVPSVNHTCTAADNSTYVVSEEYLLLLPIDCSCASCV